MDTQKIQSNLVGGVTKLVGRAAKYASNPTSHISVALVAIASAFLVALCLVNHFFVATNAGTLALHSNNAWQKGCGDTHDEGVIFAIGGSTKKKSMTPVTGLVATHPAHPGL